MNLAGESVKKIDFCIVNQGCPDSIHPVEIEIASSDYSIQRSIYGLDLRCCGTQFPLPDVTVCIGVSVNGIDEVCLDVRSKYKISRIYGFESGINAGQCLFGIIKSAHSLFLWNGVGRIFVQAG